MFANCNLRKSVRCGLILFSAVLVFSGQAIAAPWDTDLFKQQSYKANELARTPVKGTVPLGSTPYTITTLEEAAQNKNPRAFELHSVWRGMRLFDSNCWTCHGKKLDGTGPVGPQMGVPSLLQDFYRNKPDGVIFHVIQKGGANMPRYGYKFSPTEAWDIVNYVRFLQGRDIEGMKRPE